MTNRTQAGFTLIELMIVVAIIGVLSSIAIPAYYDYLVRAKVSEGITRLSSNKTHIEEYFAVEGRMPQNAAEAAINLNTPGGYIRNLRLWTWGSCVALAAEMDRHALGDTLPTTWFYDFYIQANVTPSGLEWKCRAWDLPSEYLPPECRIPSPTPCL